MRGAILAARLLLSVTALGLGLLAPLADLSASHAFNNAWPPHARLHSVWLVGVLAGIALAMLVLIWAGPRSQSRLRLGLALALGWIALVPFGLAALAMPLYGGALHGRHGGIEILGLDSNLVGFVAGTAMLIVSGVLIARSQRRRS